MIETNMNASPRLGMNSLDFKDAIEVPSLNYLYEFSGSSLPHQSHDFLAHDVSLEDMVGVKDDDGTMCVEDAYSNFNLKMSQDTMGNLPSSKHNNSFYSSLGDCLPSCWAENSNMGDTNMEVVILPEYAIYQDSCYTGLKLTFSKTHIQISSAFENDGAFNIEMAVRDLVEIKSQLFQSNETVMMELCVFNSCTLGIEKLMIVVVDSNWSLTLSMITSLNFEYSTIWKIATEVDVECNENFSRGPTSYFPNFEVAFDEVVYPKGDPDAVSLSKRDVDLLQPDTYINDTVIDFYIQYLKNKIPKDQKSRFHFFNSFFFRKLADIDKDPSSACDGKAAFLRVRKWTRKVNIFEKNYIFIPVNFNLHWSLIVICHPGEVVNFNDKELDKSPRVPCILHMDSVKGFHGGCGLKNLVQSYLNEEWKERQKNTCGEGEDMSSRFLNMWFLPVEVPQQQNSYDCGLFLLHYLELFLAEVPYNFNPLELSKFSNFLNLNWFQPEEAYLKRTLIQRLIFELVVKDGSHKGFSSNDSGDRRCLENNDNWTANHCPTVNGESHSSKGIEMTVLPASSSPILKEFFEPGASLEHSESFDQRSSGHYLSSLMFPTMEETDLSDHLTRITTDPNFQQVSGFSPPPQSCSLPLEISHRPTTSEEAEHVKAESSRGASSCTPDDSDDDIEIIENFSLQSEARSLHDEERCQENSACIEFKPDLTHITTDPNFQQVSGFSPPPQSCSLSLEISHRPTTPEEAEHVKAESSRGVSSCTPDDSDDDIEIIENFSLQSEARSLHDEERCQENPACIEFKPDLKHITTDPNFLQVSGFSPPPQSCSLPLKISHRPTTSEEAEHVKAGSSRGASSCTPDDSDDDIEIIENFSLQSEARSLHEEERCQENSASIEFKPDLWNIPDTNDSPTVNIPVNSFVEIPPYSNSSYGENNLSYQETLTLTIPFHQVSIAVDNNIRYENLQIIDNMKSETCEEQRTKERWDNLQIIDNMESETCEEQPTKERRDYIQIVDNMESETCEEQPTKKRRDYIQIVDNMESETCEEQPTKKRRFLDCDKDLMMGPDREKPNIWKIYTRRNKRGLNREKPKIWKVYKRKSKSGDISGKQYVG